MTSNEKSYLLPGDKGIKVTPITSITAQGGIKLEFTTPSGAKCVFIVPLKDGAK